MGKNKNKNKGPEQQQQQSGAPATNPPGNVAAAAPRPPVAQAAAPAPQQNPQNTAARDNQPKGQTKGGNQKNPQQGGQKQNPQQGGNQQNFQQGGQRQNPQQGFQGQNPQQGGLRQNPQQGGYQQNPQQGGQRQNPQQGGQNPQQGFQGQNPQQGGQRQNPQQGFQGQNPQQGIQGHNPQQGFQGHNPQHGGPPSRAAFGPPHGQPSSAPSWGNSRPQSQQKEWNNPQTQQRPTSQQNFANTGSSGGRPQQPMTQFPQQQPQRSASQQSVASNASSGRQQPAGKPGQPEQWAFKPKYNKAMIPILNSSNASKWEGKMGKPFKVDVNYLSILIDKMVSEAYHYDVKFDPDRPKKFLHDALIAFQRQFFPDHLFAFDGRQNVYTAKKLPQDEFEGKFTLALGSRNKEYTIKIKLATPVDMSVLKSYKDPSFTNFEKPMQALQCLDIVLRSAFARNEGVVANRSIYFKPAKYMNLQDGYELWLGLFQSAVLGRKQLYLNVDVSHKAFPSEVRMLDLVCDVTRARDVPATIGRYECEDIERFLKGLEITYKIGDIERSMKFNGLKKSAKDQKFKKDDGSEMSIFDYFRTEKNLTLKYPGLPVMHVGSTVRNVCVPMELCYLPAGQSTNRKCTPKVVSEIIRYSATSTSERKEKIVNLLNRIQFDTAGTVLQFGVNVKKTFENVDARVINPPEIAYNGRSSRPSKGVWRQDGKFMVTQSAPIKWTILNFDDRNNFPSLVAFKDMMMKSAKQQNVMLADVESSSIQTIRVNDDIDSVLKKYMQNGYKFLVVIIQDRNDNYAKVKQSAELRCGILTQCIKSFTFQRKMNFATLENILLKVNSKLGGTNHEILEPFFNKSCKNKGIMFVGGDVTHPTPDQTEIPSVVGVAASYDQFGFRYNCSWRLQGPREEMISDFENILLEHLNFYKSKNGGVLPLKIMYYRDGVSDGQFQEVLDIEMTALRKACAKAGPQYKPQVTFIICQKRHHTRFFPKPQDGEGKNNNVKPGTVVDKDIVHPHQYQFFLASHAAIQGVTKPTKYCVLLDDSNIAPDDLQAITYDLCHLFTRCNRSVSYVAPTYYAHLVAARGKNYIVGQRLNFNNLNQEYKSRVIKPDFYGAHPMFFV